MKRRILAVIASGMALVATAQGTAPASTPARIAELEGEVARLRAELAAAGFTGAKLGVPDWSPSAPAPRRDPGSWRPLSPHPGDRPPLAPLEYWTWPLTVPHGYRCPCACSPWPPAWNAFPTLP